MILLLEALDVLGRELPDAISKPDSAGLTFISRFISVNFMTIYETEAEKRVAQDTWEEPAIREVSPSASLWLYLYSRFKEVCGLTSCSSCPVDAARLTGSSSASGTALSTRKGTSLRRAS